jgi:L-serine/L-threonine ammonia-lyase
MPIPVNPIADEGESEGQQPFKPLHITTPLVYSDRLSANSGHNVWLKLETKQPSGSFKSRGIGRACWAATKHFGSKTHLVAASGGNAGLAAAMSGQRLGVKTTIFVHDTTEKAILDKLEGFGAEVTRMDGGWERVNAGAKDMVKDDPYGVYIHPFEGDDVVIGHMGIIDEIYDQLASDAEQKGLDKDNMRPHVITSAVGGGGFIRGIMYGCSEYARKRQIRPAHVLGVTTIGGDSWGLSLETDDTFIELENPYSIAKSLVCKACSELAVRDARIYAASGSLTLDPKRAPGGPGPHLTEVRVDDAFAGAAAWQAGDELECLIELSTGAAMVPVYYPRILATVVEKEKPVDDRLNVVVVVCGGDRIDQEGMEGFKRSYGLGYGKIIVDGKVVEDIPKSGE